MHSIRHFFKISSVVLSCLFISACDDKLTYEYLILHPNMLEQAYSECQINDVAACQEIKRAAHEMGELVYEQASHPEEFGKRILTLQRQMQVSRKNEEQAAHQYDEQSKQLQMMYAIVASHGP